MVINLDKGYLKILKHLQKNLIEIKNNDYYDYFNNLFIFNVNLDTYDNYIMFEKVGNRLGLNIFMYNDQIRYLNDYLRSNNALIPPFGFECYYRVELVNLADMFDYEKAYYEKIGVKLQEEDNIVTYEYTIGYDGAPIFSFEIGEVDYIVHLFTKTLKRKLVEICDNKEDYELISFYYIADKLCEIDYGPFEPYIKKPRFKNYNKAIYNELKDHKRLDDSCYVISRFLPISNKGVKPLLVFFIFEKAKKPITKYINDEVETHSDIFMGMLYDLMSEYGLPNEMIFDNRIFYVASYTTLKKLGVKPILNTTDDFATERFEDTISEISLMASQENINLDELFNLIIEGVTLTTAKLTDNFNFSSEEPDEEYLKEEEARIDNDLYDDELFDDEEDYEDQTDDDTDDVDASDDLDEKNIQ